MHGERGYRWGDLVKDFLEPGVGKYLLLPALEHRFLFAGSLLFSHLFNETRATDLANPSLQSTFILVSSLAVMVMVQV